MTDPTETTPPAASAYQPAPTYEPYASAPGAPGQPPAAGASAPSAGAAETGAPAYGAPAYGAPAAGAPAYGAPATGAPAYGAPPTGVPAYGAPATGAPAYPAPGYGTPGGWMAPAPVVRPRGLGLTAMIIAAAVFVLSVVASVIVGTSAGPLATRGTTSFSFNTNNLTPEQLQGFAPIAVLMGAQMLVGTVLGILALVLGIVAVATKRGRPFGVVAIIVAVAAPIVSFAVYTGTLIATLPPA